jgi:hypothetical protein
MWERRGLPNLSTDTGRILNHTGLLEWTKTSRRLIQRRNNNCSFNFCLKRWSNTGYSLNTCTVWIRKAFLLGSLEEAKGSPVKPCGIARKEEKLFKMGIESG